MRIDEEVADIPLFGHHPAHADKAGQRRKAPMQDMDRAATFVELVGYFGGAVNLADGTHTDHRSPADLATQEIYQYTPMPFTKGVPLLKVPVIDTSPMYNTDGPGCLLEDETRLYDIQAGHGQEHPTDNAAPEGRLAALMTRRMAENDAPPEAFARLQLQAA